MDELHNNQSHIADKVRQMLDDGKTRAEAEAELTAMGFAYQFVKDIVAETVKLRNAQRQQRGLNLVLSGALMCLLSCLLTLGEVFSGVGYLVVLYGLTGAGVMVVFYGLTHIF